MDPVFAVLVAIASATLGVIITKLLDYIFRIINGRWWIYIVIFVAITLVFLVAYAASPYFRDVLKAYFDSSRTERQCFFDAQIQNPSGADSKTGAHAFITSPDNKISWVPNCVMVVQAYQDTVLLTELRDQNSGESTVQEAARGTFGVIELKIFQAGFETASSNVWIEVTP